MRGSQSCHSTRSYGKHNTWGRATGNINLFRETSGTNEVTKTTITKLQRIAEISRANHSSEFNWLMPHFSKENLLNCFHELDGNKAVGVDGQSKEEYSRNLDRNIENLISRMKSLSYRPQAIRQVLIPKRDGGTRPLGISVIEDKIVQLMTAKILESIYEPIFRDCSFGFRPNRNCHMAVGSIVTFAFKNWKVSVIDLDFSNFFGSIKHDKLLALLRLRIKDETFIRYIGRMLKADILTDKGLIVSENGTAQGSISSPILANIFAHYAVDIWFEDTIRPSLIGQCLLTRYCDDLVMCFFSEKERDAVWEALKARMERFSLTIHPTKTTLPTMDKKRYATIGQNNGFSFLGFYFFLGLSGKGFVVPKLKTEPKRMRKKLKEIKCWIRDNRHRYRMKDLWLRLIAVLRGYMQYYCVTHNMPAVSKFFHNCRNIFYKWMNRRSQKKSISWEKFDLFTKRFPMPRLRITVNLL